MAFGPSLVKKERIKIRIIHFSQIHIQQKTLDILDFSKIFPNRQCLVEQWAVSTRGESVKESIYL
jgi:hypothetical protein